MRVETINAPDFKTAELICPWAYVIIEVDTGYPGDTLWNCFESTEDATAWRNQQ